MKVWRIINIETCEVEETIPMMPYNDAISELYAMFGLTLDRFRLKEDEILDIEEYDGSWGDHDPNYDF